MPTEIEQILTLDDYAIVTQGGGYREEVIEIDVDGGVYTPPLPDIQNLTKYDFTGFDVGPLSSITESCVAVAQYRLVTYTVTFVTEFGTVEPQIIARGDQLTQPIIQNAPSRYAYIFDGWYADSGYTESVVFPKVINNDLTLYAKWKMAYLEIYSPTGSLNGNSYKVSVKVSSGQELWYTETPESTSPYVWHPVTGDIVNEITWKAGVSVYFRGELGSNNSQSDYTHFSLTNGDFTVRGNINTLWDYNTWNDVQLKDYCAYNLFSGNTRLLNISELHLPSESLSFACYKDMFNGCTRLTTTPELPATTLETSCYNSMFSSCTSLTTAPELPSTTLGTYCYQCMFSGCTSLTTAPELPATTLAVGCYNGMFNGCTRITEAPELPAVTLVGHCYETMFYGCSSLNYIKCLAINGIDAYDSTTDWVNGVASRGTFVKDENATWPVGNNGIPLEWIGSYIKFTVKETGQNNGIGIFNGGNNAPNIEYSLDDGSTWTTWDYSPIMLVNSGDSVYMRGINTNGFSTSFSNYSNFVMQGEIEAEGNTMALIDYRQELDTIPCDYCFYMLFRDCTSLTKAPELPATNLTNNCYYSMFYGCTKLTVAPELPATILTNTCYGNMFFGCANLTKAPELPATDLIDGCYYMMFNGCRSLNYIKCFAINGINTNGSTDFWVNGVATTGTFYKQPDVTWPTGINGIPNGWTFSIIPS